MNRKKLREKKLKGVMSVGMLVGMVIVAVVLGSMMTTVTDNTIGIGWDSNYTNCVNSTCDGGYNASSTNVTGATRTLVTLVPLFLVIAVVMGFVLTGRKS